MNSVFEIDCAKVADEARFAEYARELAALSPIDSKKSFNRFCRKACATWKEILPNEHAPASQKFGELLQRIDDRGDNIIPTTWGGVVVTRHEHPEVEKYLVVRRGNYLALEKHAEKDERLEVQEGAGLLLWRQPNELRLTMAVVRPRDRFHFAPGQEHCLIGTENLLVFERSIDPKGMDQDLIFIFEPDATSN